MGFRLFLLIVIPFQLFGQLVIDDNNEGIPLVGNPNVKLLKAVKNLSFEEVKTLEFINDYQEGDYPEKNSPIWLKLRLVSQSEDSLVYLFSEADYYTVYFDRAHDNQGLTNGFLVPINQRVNKKSSQFISFKMPPGHAEDIFLKLETSGFDKAYGHPVIGNQNFYFKKTYEVAQFNEPNKYLSLIYLSGIIVVFIFILMQYVSLRDEVYRYYILYLLSQLLFGFVTLVKTPIYFLNIGLYYPKLFYYGNESSQFLFIGIYVLFVLKLFEFKKEDAIYRFMTYFAYSCFGYAVFSLLFLLSGPTYQTRYLIFNIVRYIVVPVNLILIFWIIKKVKDAIILYFIVAHLFFFAGTIISVYAQMNGLDRDPDSIFYFKNSLNVIFQMGLLGEAVCFSLALALRIKYIQQDREKNTLAYINQLKENELIKERMNQELDIKVRQTTEELEEIYSEVERQREREITLEFSKKIQEMEMTALRSQMNPHFLFNSMNAIKHLILTQRFDEGINYLDDFSGLLRKVLQSSKQQTITVEEELEVLELYLSLEKARMGDELEYEIILNNPEVLSQYTIPGLFLQPFVENAIWHGLLPSSKKRKMLTIRFETEGNLKISIQDNGIGRAASQAQKEFVISMHQSMGMKIAENRLNLFNQSHNFRIDLEIIDLETDSGEIDGTLVVLHYSI